MYEVGVEQLQVVVEFVDLGVDGGGEVEFVVLCFVGADVLELVVYCRG